MHLCRGWWHKFLRISCDSYKNPDAGFKLGEMVFIEQIASAVTKGNAGLADAWNKALAATMADGSYAAVSTKYFNEDVRCH